MEFNSLDAISPIDGRYRSKSELLAKYFSEAALIRYRVRIEVEYFIALCELPLPELNSFPKEQYPALRNIYTEFTNDDALKVKESESVTNHDVKAVEYFLKKRFVELGLDEFKEFIHFGLTSQDINNTAVPLSIKEVCEDQLFPKILALVQALEKRALSWADISMLAKTHGQPASPTRLGKEVMVFVERLKTQMKHLTTVPFAAKFGGAVGNFNAHHVAYPDIDWVAFANKLVNDTLGLSRSQTTTQIEHYDQLAALLDALKRINTILIDLNRDIWTYISMDYFKQEIKAGEIGSSAMPHKVNPIDFENSEGNLGIANAMLEHLSGKLPVSRLQRDLTDSTVIRNVGVPFAHTFIALHSLEKGLSKLIVNKDAMFRDLEDNWAVVAEAIQTILRKNKYPEPYEALKALTRTNEKITAETMSRFIDGLDVSAEVKEQMHQISPHNYTGITMI